MGQLNQILKQELGNALQKSRNLSSMNMNQSFLPVFIRVSKVDAKEVSDAIDIYISNMKTHRWNAVYSLYALAVIADINIDTKKLILSKFGRKELEYYIGDEDVSISNNAKILNEVLNGKSLSSFKKKKEAKSIASVHIGDNIAGDYISIADNKVSENGALIKLRKDEGNQRWHESPLGIIILAVIAGVIIGAILWYFRIN